MPKNVKILLIILVILLIVYFVFVKKPKEDVGNLVSSNPLTPIGEVGDQGPSLAQDFLTDLLNVKSIKLNDSIFSDPAFATLVDSTIVITQDGTEGRPNPFAPIGSDVIKVPVSPTPTTETSTETP